jgi:hypothetical protein
LVEQGHTRGIAEPPAAAATPDEFLAPILDVIPAQLFADALARRNNIDATFRYIGKVVTQI